MVCMHAFFSLSHPHQKNSFYSVKTGIFLIKLSLPWKNACEKSKLEYCNKFFLLSQQNEKNKRKKESVKWKKIESRFLPFLILSLHIFFSPFFPRIITKPHKMRNIYLRRYLTTTRKKSYGIIIFFLLRFLHCVCVVGKKYSPILFHYFWYVVFLPPITHIRHKMVFTLL